MRVFKIMNQSLISVAVVEKEECLRLGEIARFIKTSGSDLDSFSCSQIVNQITNGITESVNSPHSHVADDTN